MKFKPATKRDFEAYWGKSKLKDTQPPVLALAFKEIAKEAWEDGHEVGYDHGRDEGYSQGYDHATQT